MSWCHTKKKNLHGEHEVRFGTKDLGKAKAVKKVCLAAVDRKINSPDDIEIVTHCRDCRHWVSADPENTGVCDILVGLDFALEPDDYCSYGEKEANR